MFRAYGASVHLVPLAEFKPAAPRQRAFERTVYAPVDPLAGAATASVRLAHHVKVVRASNGRPKTSESKD